MARGEFRAPLVIGDRLDTDIEGANAAQLPSLMVLTGVNNARDAVFARPEQRPTYIGHDLRSLRQDGKLLAVGPQPGWQVDVGDHAVTVSGMAATTRTDCRSSGLSPARYGALKAPISTGRRCASKPPTARPATRCSAGLCCMTPDGSSVEPP